MIRGLLTDPACDGSIAHQNDALADSDEYLDVITAERAARIAAWQTRDLDRLKSRDSDEITTW